MKGKKSMQILSKVSVLLLSSYLVTLHPYFSHKAEQQEKACIREAR